MAVDQVENDENSGPTFALSGMLSFVSFQLMPMRFNFVVSLIQKNSNFGSTLPILHRNTSRSNSGARRLLYGLQS
jgi:hypothetical protein